MTEYKTGGFDIFENVGTVRAQQIKDLKVNCTLSNPPQPPSREEWLRDALVRAKRQDVQITAISEKQFQKVLDSIK